MVFEGDSLKDYILDFKDNKLVKVELPNVKKRKVGKWIKTAEDYYKAIQIFRQVQIERC